jgi:hypothetical protein
LKQSRRTRCEWRETSLMLALLCRAVSPALSLLDAVKRWAEIALRLAEPPRKRVRQRSKLEAILG